MKILEIKVMRGPNYWSNYRKKLIVMKLDLEHLEEYPTNRIDGFPERVEQFMPSLYSHRCSGDHAGGFFERLQKGTWMGHVIEHIALELQTLAGMEVGFGRTRGADKEGVYYVVFSYEIERAGIYAAEAAVRIAEALEADQPYDLSQDLMKLTEIRVQDGLGPSTKSIVTEAENRDIPWRRLDDGSLILLGQGENQKMIQASVAGTTSGLAIDLAGDKNETKRYLSCSFIPVPEGTTLSDVKDLPRVIKKLGFPLVFKPLDGNHGRGITTNITGYKGAEEAFHIAQKISPEVIAEKFIQGSDYRFLVVNYKFVAAALRTPAMVMGDGQSTIQQLIDEVNSDPRRGDGHDNVLTKIVVNDATIALLKARDLTPDSVLSLGEIVMLKDTANLSSGGTAADVTDLVHPTNKLMAERIARLMNLDICGIDVVSQDISIPFSDNKAAVIEVNAGPGLRMHLAPSSGKPRNVARPVIDMLFPAGKQSRIPIVAVTGTNGKTTTVRLMAHLAQLAGYKTGMTTTDGIYIDGQPIYFGDCSGPSSAEAVLIDPIVNYAVLECARGGILRSGLGFDKSDVSIITNVKEDHLGLNGIHTVRQLARVKAVVARSTKDDGTCVLNADDDLVYDMREFLDCKIALFSMDASNVRIQEHIAAGGTAVYAEDENLIITHNWTSTTLMRIDEIPLTFNGRCPAMIANVLATVAAAVVQDFDFDLIRKGLTLFTPSVESTPGRMNVFEFGNYKVMLDYAHNTDGYKELEKFMKNMKASVKTGIIAATGDRRDDDIRNLGRYAAKMFNEIIIRHDEDSRGRDNEQLTNLLAEGVHETDPHRNITVITSEKDAIAYAMDHAQPDSFIVVCADKVRRTIGYIQDEQMKRGVLINTDMQHMRTA